MITALEAKSLATPVTLAEIEDAIRHRAQAGGLGVIYPVHRWNGELDAVLTDAGYIVRRGGIDDACVVVEWK